MSTGAATGPPAPLRSPRTGPRPRLAARAGRAGTSSRACTGSSSTGTTGEWFSQSPDERRLVAETAIEQVAGRVPVVIGCTSLTARRRSSSAGTRSLPAPTGIGSTPPPYSKTYPDETVRYFEDISAGVDGAADGLQLAARNERRHRPRPRRAARRHRERRRRSRTARPTSPSSSRPQSGSSDRCACSACS